jgi:hypothetical protein
MIRLSSAILLTTVALATGCMKTTVKTGAPPGATSDHTVKFFIAGLVGEENFNLDQMCPSGVSKIEEEIDFGNGLVACVTCSIYTPRSVKITCASGSAYLLSPDEEENRTLVSPALATNLTGLE